MTATILGPWADLAACTGLDPDIFFPAAGDQRGMDYAKSICAECEVRDECLEHAQSHDEVHGIWGGLNARERSRLRRAARHLRRVA